jgi:hypothetical protein
MNRRRVTRLAALYCLLVGVTLTLLLLVGCIRPGPIDAALATHAAAQATADYGATAWAAQLTAVAPTP